MSIMPKYMNFTPAEQAKLTDIQTKAKARHEKDRRAARQRGRVDFPGMPYECSWAYEEQFRREHCGVRIAEDVEQERIETNASPYYIVPPL